jgi:hypothetical protein
MTGNREQSPYDFDECDEMTLCALATAKDIRDRIEAHLGVRSPEAVDVVDAYAQEIVDREREDDDE